MIASAHIAAGAVAGMAGSYSSRNRIQRIAVAFGLGLLSHVVLDAVPHSDYASLSPSTVLWVALCEMVVVGGVAGYIVRRRLFPHWPEYLGAGVAGAVLPDAKFIAAVFLSRHVVLVVSRYGDQFHGFFHAAPPSIPLLGLSVEVACTLVLLAVLLVFPRTLRPR